MLKLRGIDMDILDRYPELKEKFETLCQTRRDEILACLVDSDSEYDNLSQKRVDASMALKTAISELEADKLFEVYTDTVYDQEIYEIDAVYKQAWIDALEAMKEKGLL
jgi:hypothetical protein